MMAPDYAHWHGMYEVAERFYMELIPQARELAKHAKEHGQTEQASVVESLITDILARPEHEWFEQQRRLAEQSPANTITPAAEGTGELSTGDESNNDEAAADE